MFEDLFEIGFEVAVVGVVMLVVMKILCLEQLAWQVDNAPVLYCQHRSRYLLKEKSFTVESVATGHVYPSDPSRYEKRREPRLADNLHVEISIDVLTRCSVIFPLNGDADHCVSYSEIWILIFQTVF